MLNLNSSTLQAVISQAIADAAGSARWQHAIHRAALELEQNPYIARDADHGGLLIGSPSGRVYAANGICQCEAFTYGRPCWHRAAARLVRRHDERQAKAEIDADMRARWAKAQAEMDELYA